MNLTIPDFFYWDEIDEVLDGFGPRFCTIWQSPSSLAEGSKNVAVPRLCGSTLVTQNVLEIQNKLG